MKIQNDPIHGSTPLAQSINRWRYQKISAIELLKIKNYISDMDKLQLLQKHRLSERDYDIMKQKLVLKKNYAEIAMQYGWTGEWTRQIFLKLATYLKSSCIL